MSAHHTERHTGDQSFLPPLWIITLLTIAGLFWLLVTLKELVVLMVVGYSLAYLIAPLLSWLERREISRAVGFFVVTGVFLIVLLVIATTALPTILEQVHRLSENFPDYITTARKKAAELWATILSRLPADYQRRLTLSPDDLFEYLGPDTLSGVALGLTGALLRGYSITLTVLNLALLPFIVFYLAVDFRYFHSAALSLFPKKYQATVRTLSRQIDTHVSAFVRGQLIVGSILFVLYAIGLGIVGVELWLLIAFIAGFGNLIPYFGTFVGVILASIMALVTFGDLHHLYYVWGIFAAAQFLEGTLITPKIVGSQVGLSPLTVILAIFAAGKIFGLIGLFLAIPLAAALRVTGQYLHSWFLQRIGT